MIRVESIATFLLRPGPRRRRARVAVLLALVGALVVFRVPLWGGNFGVVDPGRVVRSAQPNRTLDALIRTQHLGSILNLRGGSEDDPWYVGEVRAADARNVEFYDLPMSATRRPSRRELLLLLDLFERCRYPLLIHCKSGSDRTGLASGLYLMAVRGQPPEQALRAFTLRYGHFPIGGPEHLHEPFREYDGWLRARHLAHTPARLRAWVEHDYRADDPLAAYRPLQPGPRVRIERGLRR